MGTESEVNHPLSFFFIPLMSPGHMNPTIDMAKLFALRQGISVTIVTTPGNAYRVQSSINSFPIKIQLIIVSFPSHIASQYIRDGKENLSLLSFSEFPDFFKAFYALQEPIEDVLYAHRPDCIIADYMFHWMTDTAIKLNIPRIVFYGHGIFTSCVHQSLEIHKPYEKVLDDSEEFVVEDIPHHIELVKSEVSLAVIYTTEQMRESAEKCFGIVVNSFYGLEPEYAELYRGKLGRRRYYVGPVAMVNEHSTTTEIDLEIGLMTWLDSMKENSVVYACFGSLNEFSNDQLHEIASGIEASGKRFIWVARNNKNVFLPDGFEERVKGKGVVIKGWAPQVAILNHHAIGGFITHCGWNSTLESIAASVPMVTWPVEYEQFVNEKLITKLLDIGVSVRNGEKGEKLVKAKKIADAIESLMSDCAEAKGRRERVKNYAMMAKAALAEGGSSYVDMTQLIDDIKDHSFSKRNGEVVQ